MRKFATLTFIFIACFFALFASSPALADSVSDYQQKVADAKAKIADLQNQLAQAQADLDSWSNSSNDQANQINDAQTAVMNAQDVLDSAQADYVAKRADYDAVFVDVQSAETVVAQAIQAVNDAVDVVDSTYVAYQQAQSISDSAQSDMNQAKSDYDTKLINAGGQGATSGLAVDVYTGVNRLGNPPSRSDVTYTKCKTVTVSNIEANWGNGNILGCGSDYVMLHYRGYITYPTTTKVYFQAPADDGFFMTIGGQTVINDWSLKGCGANSIGIYSFTGGKSYQVDAWFYEWTGGACSTLTYKPSTSNSYAVVPASMFTQDAVVQLVKDPALKAVWDSKTAIYVQAVALEEQANQVYLNALAKYDGAMQAYGFAGQSLSAQRSILSGKDVLVQSAEDTWQKASDDKAVCDADLRDLKTQYASIFTAMDNAQNRVDQLTVDLQQARDDLANIPKPSASDKRAPKKVVAKYFADAAYVPRGGFVPSPK